MVEPTHAGLLMNEQGDRDSTPSFPDRQSWIESAINDHEGPLVRYAQHFLGDSERARDVVQDTFVQLLKSDRQAIGGHLRAWLFRVCRNRAIDICRKESRMKTTETQMLDQTVNGSETPAAILEQSEKSRHIQSLIEDLDQRQQEIIRLKFQNAMSYREIASVMGLSVTNVGFILHKALQKVRQRAADKFEVDPKRV